MIVSLCLLVIYCMFIYLSLIVALIFAKNMDRNSNEAGNHRNNRQRNSSTNNIIESLLAAEEELLRQRRAAMTPSARSSTSNASSLRFSLSDIDNSVFRSPSIVSGARTAQYDSFSDLYNQHNVSLPTMPTPRFGESSYAERPHCPVPNNQMFMPPSIFNPQLFANRVHSSTAQRQSSGAHPFNTATPGPSHSRDAQLSSASSRIARLELTEEQKAVLRREFGQASKVFSSIAKVIGHGRNARAAGTFRPTSTRSASVGSFSAGSSSVGPYNAGSSSVGPYNARSSSIGPYNARSSNVGPYNARSSSVGPYNARSSSIGPYNARSSSIGPYNARSSSVGSFNARPSTVGPYNARSSSVGSVNARSATVGPVNARPSTVGPVNATSVNVGPCNAKPSTVGSCNAKPSNIGSLNAIPTNAVPRNDLALSANIGPINEPITLGPIIGTASEESLLSSEPPVIYEPNAPIRLPVPCVLRVYPDATTAQQDQEAANDDNAVNPKSGLKRKNCDDAD